MAEIQERPSFLFYASFENMLAKIEESSKDMQLSLYRAIVRYGLFHEAPKLCGVADVMWELIRPILDNQWTKYLNGCKGGAPKGNKNAEKNNLKTSEKQPKNNLKTSNVNVNVNVNENENVSSSKDITDDDDDFSFICSFDVGNVPSGYVVKSYQEFLKTHDIRDIKAYFPKWWNGQGGDIIQSYNNLKAAEEERKRNDARLSPSQQKAVNDARFAEWCESQGYTAESIPPELARNFKG